MRKYIKKLINEFLRISVKLDNEIVNIVKKYPKISTKSFIVNIIDTRYPSMFSQFEVEYTIARLVCDNRLITNGIFYATPNAKNPVADEIRIRKQIENILQQQQQ